MSKRIVFREKIFLIIFSSILILLIVELSFRLGGFLLSLERNKRNLIAKQQTGAYKILCIGESTTFMGGDPKNYYPYKLENILNKKSKDITFEVINKGRPGTTTEYILADIKNNIAEYNPNMVVAMMGINDELYGLGERVGYKNDFLIRVVKFIKSLKLYKVFRYIELSFKNKFGLNNKQIKITNLLGTKQPCLGLTWGYGVQGRTFKQAGIKCGPECKFIETGLLLRDQVKVISAIEMFKKAYQLNPKNEWSLLEWGYTLILMRKPFASEQIYLKALDINPLNAETYFRLGGSYSHQGNRDDKKIEVFSKVIALDPERIDGYMELATAYKDAKDYVNLEKLYKKAILMNPDNPWGYGCLATFYKKRGLDDLAAENYRVVNELYKKNYNSLTKENFQNLTNILNEKNIKFVAMQYPMRSIDSLKKIFSEDYGIIFVDNEKLFYEAVMKEGYGEYFIDNFAGDFGHCTSKGNSMLANNLADIILREINKNKK